MVGCPVGLGLRLTGDKAYERLLVETSETLLKRFDPKVGLIRSWDNKNRQPDPYLVIIDNMMNLEMLFEASRLTGPIPRFRDVAVTMPTPRCATISAKTAAPITSSFTTPPRAVCASTAAVRAILRLRRGPAVRVGVSTALRCATARRATRVIWPVP